MNRIHRLDDCLGSFKTLLLSVLLISLFSEAMASEKTAEKNTVVDLEKLSLGKVNFLENKPDFKLLKVVPVNERTFEIFYRFKRRDQIKDLEMGFTRSLANVSDHSIDVENKITKESGSFLWTPSIWSGNYYLYALFLAGDRRKFTVYQKKVSITAKTDLGVSIDKKEKLSNSAWRVEFLVRNDGPLAALGTRLFVSMGPTVMLQDSDHAAELVKNKSTNSNSASPLKIIHFILEPLKSSKPSALK